MMPHRLARGAARALSGTLLGGLLFAAGGSASGLSVNGSVLQAGGDADIRCDVNGVTVGYSVAYTGSDFKLTHATVNGFANNCIGKIVEVVLTQGGVPVASASGIVLLSGPSNNRTTGPLAVSPQPLAAIVNDVHVLVVDDAGP